jgi:hypothetical protein
MLDGLENKKKDGLEGNYGKGTSKKTQKSSSGKVMLDVLAVVDVDLGENEIEVADNLEVCIGFHNGRKRKKEVNCVGKGEKREGKETADTADGNSGLGQVVKDQGKCVGKLELHKKGFDKGIGDREKESTGKSEVDNMTTRGKHPRKKSTK